MLDSYYIHHSPSWEKNREDTPINEGSLGAGVRDALGLIDSAQSFDLSKSSPFYLLGLLSDKVLYTLWTFLTPEETSLASWLLILQRVQPISEKKHTNHLGHDMITFAKKTF